MPKGKGYGLAKQFSGKVNPSRLANAERKRNKLRNVAKKAGK